MRLALFFRIALIASIGLFSLHNVAQAQWTRNLEVTMTSRAFKVAKSHGLSDDTASDYALCVFDGIVKKVPNPETPPEGADLKRIGEEATLECLAKFGKWNADTEGSLRELLLAEENIDKFEPEMRNRFVNCAITKLKTKFPGGIHTVNWEEGEMIGKECGKEVVKDMESAKPKVNN